SVERALADPMLNNNFFPIASNAQQTASGRMQNSISLTQAVPWPEKLKAKEAIAAREVCIAQAEVKSIEREIAETVRLAYYEIWLAQRGQEIVRENQKLVDDLIRVAEARYKSGGSQQDVINAEIERERLSRQQFELEGQSQAAQADLAALLQQPQSLSITTDADLPFVNLPTRLDELVALAEQCNPELRGLGFEIQRDIQKRRLADLQRYSDFQFGAGYDFMTTSQALSPVADGVDNISFGVGMTLPVWREKIRAGVAESSAQVASSARLRDAEKLSIAGRLRRLLAEIDSLDQQRTVYTERILPRAEQAVKIATSEYTVSKTSFVQLTDNYRELLGFQFQVIQIEASLASRLAQLERTVGCRDTQFAP
ncbi:MAG: TolC family protein, partial [Aureliella sp.]